MSGPEGTPNGADRLARIEAARPGGDGWVSIKARDRDALVEIAKAAREGVRLLDSCLNDDRAWDGEELVALMETVRELHAAALARLDSPSSGTDSGAAE